MFTIQCLTIKFSKQNIKTDVTRDPSAKPLGMLNIREDRSEHNLKCVCHLSLVTRIWSMTTTEHSTVIF